MLDVSRRPHETTALWNGLLGRRVRNLSVASSLLWVSLWSKFTLWGINSLVLTGCVAGPSGQLQGQIQWVQVRVDMGPGAVSAPPITGDIIKVMPKPRAHSAVTEAACSVRRWVTASVEPLH